MDSVTHLSHDFNNQLSQLGAWAMGPHVFDNIIVENKKHQGQNNKHNVRTVTVLPLYLKPRSFEFPFISNVSLMPKRFQKVKFYIVLFKTPLIRTYLTMVIARWLHK